MKIPFAKPIINTSEIKLVTKVLKSPILTHGKRSIEFEKVFSNFTKKILKNIEIQVLFG